jgi:hypothetical protein
MEELKELERKHEEMGELIAKIKEQEKSKDDYVLMVKIGRLYNDLVIGFNLNDKFKEIGYVSTLGECKILNDKVSVEYYELWREKGMKVCTDKVKWRGKYYKLNDGTCGLYEVNSRSTIYDFKNCNYISGCQDNNIVRFKHNNKPIGF